MTPNLSFPFEDNSITARAASSTPVVGLEIRVEVLREKLKLAPRLGVTGEGGIGKTTLAQAVFDAISMEFEYTCFLEEAKETVPIYHGDLRAAIASRLHHWDDLVPSTFEWSTLEGKRVLVILDDAEDQSQVSLMMSEMLAFSVESRLIVTARNGQFLVREGFEIYEAKKLSFHESKRLLCAHAFKTTVTPKGFESRVTRLVKSCEHLPLALKVVGGYIHRSNEEVWNHPLDFACSPLSWTDGSRSILTASYSSMTPTERELFLEIATYFHGEKLEEVQHAWTRGHESAGWQTLLDKCFVGIRYRGGHLLIWVHEILRKFGRAMAKSENLNVFNNVQTVNRILNQDATQVSVLKMVQHDRGDGPLPLDINEVLGLKELRTLWLEGVYCHDVSAPHRIPTTQIRFLKIKVFASEMGQRIRWSAVSLNWISEIQSLRCMILDGLLSLPHSFNSLQALQYLNISNCPGSNFHPAVFANLQALEHLTICNCPGLTDLPISITQLETLCHLRIEGCRDLKALPDTFGILQDRLQHLKIFHCQLLTALPDSFGLLRGLEHFIISDCSSLQRLPESVMELEHLQHLDIRRCRSLTALPDSFGLLQGLQHFIMSECSGLQRLPESFVKLERLQHLEIVHCGSLTALPDSFGLLRGLKHFIISDCSSLQRLPESFVELEHLQHLDIRSCGSLTALPDSFGLLVGLEHFIISDCSSLQKLPESFVELEHLQHLEIRCCGSLTALPDSFGLLQGLQHFIISKCSSLQRLPELFVELEHLQHLEIRCCRSLTALPDSFGLLQGLKQFIISECSGLQRLPESFVKLQRLQHLEIVRCGSLTALPDSFGLLRGLKHFILSDCSSLQRLPESFMELEHLEHLDIRSCGSLIALPDSFGLLRGLEHFIISKCSSLQRLPESFLKLEHLQHLEIVSCWELTTLPDSFALLGGLEHFIISDCSSLQRLPESVVELEHLQHLEIRRCRSLTALPDSFGLLGGLQHFIISECSRLQRLPESFVKLERLQHLEIRRCGSLTALPDSFGLLRGLKHFIISECSRLETLPKSFMKLKHLQYLEIIRCRELTALPDSFGLLRGLKHFIISDCSSLQRLPESVVELEHLQHLEIRRCGSLTALPDSFGLLRGLEYFIISECSGLQRLPESFVKLEHLQHLEIVRCWKLTALPESFGLLRGLEHFIISECSSLQRLPESFVKLESLQHLEIVRCWKLMALPDSFGLLQSLKYLIISYCDSLRTLPKSFGGLGNLQDLEIRSCSLLKAPQECFPLLFRFQLNIYDCRSVEEILHPSKETENPKNEVFEDLYIEESGVESSEKADVLGKGKARMERNDLKHSEKNVRSTGAKQINPSQMLCAEDLIREVKEGGEADIPGKGKGVERNDSKHSEKSARSTGAKQSNPSQILCAEDLIREVEEGGEDGYLLSLKWFISLKENERVSLLSIIRKAGYLKIYESSTSMLFERIKNDVQNQTTHTGAASSARKHGAPLGHIQQAGETKKGNPMLGISKGTGLDFGSNDDPADACGSDNLPESNMYEKTKVRFPKDWPVDQGLSRLKSFIAALKSNSTDSFCVSSDWFSNLEDYEKKELDNNVAEAGYTKTYLTPNSISFERMSGNVGHPAIAPSDGPSNDSNRKEAVAIDSRKQESLSNDAPLKKKLHNEDNLSEFVGVITMTESSQDNKATCHPQLLTYQAKAIPSTLSTPSAQRDDLEILLENYRRLQFGDSVVALPQKGEAHQISTTVEKRFKLTTVDFSGPRGSATRVIPVDLVADVTTIVTCCLKIDQDPYKVRIKFEKISGKVMHQKSNEQQCNGLALASIRTSVHSRIKSNETNDPSWDEIVLVLDSEYGSEEGRIVGRGLQCLKCLGDVRNFYPGCTSVQLEGTTNITNRCRADFVNRVKTAGSLHFQDRPVIFEGKLLTERRQNLFLEVEIRYELQVSYLKPQKRIEAIAIPCSRESETIDFNCCLVITTNNFC